MYRRVRSITLFLVVVFLCTPSLLRAQRFGASAGAGMSFPIQEFADRYSSGPAGQLSGEYRIMGSISLVVSTGYTEWVIKEGAGNQLLSDAGLPGTLAIEGRIRNVPVSIGFRYYSLGSFGHTFLGLTTGTNLMKGTADAVYDLQDGSPVTSLSAQESWSSTGYAIEAGTSFSLDDSWSVLVILSYASILDLKHEIIPRSQGIPVKATPPQARTIGATIGIQYR